MREDELIEAISRSVGEGEGVLVGVGDDAALVTMGSGDLVLTTDLLLEGVHFEPAAISTVDLGYKAIVVNVSDVAAVAGSPRYATVGLALPSETPSGWVIDLYRGMGEACDEYGLSLVGGDLSRSEKVLISVTIAGEVPPGRALTRSGASAGNVIAVTGCLGAAAGGLRVGSKDAMTDWGRRLLDAQARPVARVGEAQALAAAGATAMMDLSDGLSTDLHRLCSASGVGALIDTSALPICEDLEHLDVNPLDLALNGGEDYELLVCAPGDVIEATAPKLKEHFGTPLTVVGEITTTLGVLADGRPMEAKGWDHFG